MKQTSIFITIVLLLAVALSSCLPSGQAAEDPTEAVVVQAEVTEEPTLPPPTEPPPPTKTPRPTATATPKPTATPEPTATPTPDLAATQNAEQTAIAQTRETEIKAQLEELGLDPERGHLAWLSSEPEALHLVEYNAESWEPAADELVSTDFVFSTDVTWESTGGLAICGMWLRAESYEDTAAHYLFQTMRLSGLPLWDLEYWKYNQWQTTLSPGGTTHTSDYIDEEQGATNNYVFVADGNTLVIYMNGHRTGQMMVSTLTEGLLAYYIYQQSGETTCTFVNSWLWDLAE